MFKAYHRIATLIFAATLSVPAAAGTDWINIGFARICTANWSWEDTSWVNSTKKLLTGRQFTLIKQVYESNGLDSAEFSERDATSLLESYPPRQISEGEDHVYPYQIEFLANGKARLNGEHDVEIDFEGCGGGQLTLYNIINQKGHGRFFGNLKVNGAEMKVCSIDCDRPLTKGEYRYTYIFQEQ